MRKDWTETTLGDVAQVINGSTPSTKESEYWNGDIPWITTTELTACNNGYVSSSIRTITDVAVAKGGARVVCAGTTLLGTTATIGTVALTAVETSFNQQISGLISKSEVVTNEFLFIWARGNRSQVEELAAGTSFKRISTVNLKGLEFLLPPLGEQERIVDVVSSVDAYIDALQQQADSARTARNAVLGNLCDDIAKKFPLVGLSEVAQITDCEHKTAPQAKPESFFGYSIGTRDIRNGQILYHQAKIVSKETYESWSKRGVLSKGDLIFSREAPVGQIGYVDGSRPVCLGQRTVSVTSNPEFVSSRFLMYWLTSPLTVSWFSERSVGLTVSHLNVADIKNIPFPRGLSVFEQLRVENILLSMDEVIQSTEHAVAEAKALRSGLLSDLLSGNHEIPASYDSLLGAA
jgi:type I restriction enzyme S subunit